MFLLGIFLLVRGERRISEKQTGKKMKGVAEYSSSRRWIGVSGASRSFGVGQGGANTGGYPA